MIGIKALTPKERLLRRTIQTEGCWLWTGSLLPGGYGTVSISMKPYLVHRLSWVVYRGEIPSGMVIDHMCRVRNCVNPDHLRVVTQRTNALENNTGITALNAAKNVCVNGHPFTAENTTHRTRNGKKHRACKEYQRRRTREHDAKRRPSKKKIRLESGLCLPK